MNRLLTALLCCCLIGCGVHKRPADRHPVDPPSPVKPVAETVFSLLADRIIAEPQLYDSTDFAMSVTNRLHDAHHITDDQYGKVKALIGDKRRKLTQADADAIRGL